MSKRDKTKKYQVVDFKMRNVTEEQHVIHVVVLTDGSILGAYLTEEGALNRCVEEFRHCGWRGKRSSIDWETHAKYGVFIEETSLEG